MLCLLKGRKEEKEKETERKVIRALHCQCFYTLARSREHATLSARFQRNVAARHPVKPVFRFFLTICPYPSVDPRVQPVA